MKLITDYLCNGKITDTGQEEDFLLDQDSSQLSSQILRYLMYSHSPIRFLGFLLPVWFPRNYHEKRMIKFGFEL